MIFIHLGRFSFCTAASTKQMSSFSFSARQFFSCGGCPISCSVTAADRAAARSKDTTKTKVLVTVLGFRDNSGLANYLKNGFQGVQNPVLIHWCCLCVLWTCKYGTAFIMETMEYEMTRNMTLLFFLERLLDKGEPRTLHDLSCQFGAKGFTREMRQIAGGSQSGEERQKNKDVTARRCTRFYRTTKQIDLWTWWCTGLMLKMHCGWTVLPEREQKRKYRVCK